MEGQCKAGHEPKTNSTLIPNGTSSKFTNMYRSPRLAGSLPLSCGDSRQLLTVIERSCLTGELQQHNDPARDPPTPMCPVVTVPS